MNSLSQSLFSQEGFEIIDDIVECKLFEQIKLEIGSVLLAILQPTRDFSEYNNLNEILALSTDLNPKTRSLVYNRLQQMPSLLAVPSSKNILEIASILLAQKTEFIGVWPRVQLRFDLPFVEETEILWHTDYLYNKGTKHSVTFWIPLTNYSSDMGGICYIPKSHKEISDYDFTLNMTSKSNHNYDLTPNQLSNKTIFNVVGKENQGILFDSQLVHSGVLNRGQLPRATILFRMQDLKTLEN